jgi:hypothetical protein
MSVGAGSGNRRAIVFTNTSWSETPRIRHQTARLLRDHGYEVWFFERPSSLARRRGPFTEPAEAGVTLVRTRRLAHPQLRVVEPVEWLNARLAAASARAAFARLGVRPDDLVVNFAHDAHFLRRLLPQNRIVTVIHDDFEAQARFPAFGHVTRQLRATCVASDEVLAVSQPLVDRVREWRGAELFLPWSVTPYRAPRLSVEGRDTLLFWGSVDTALDIPFILRAARELAQSRPAWRIALIGPTQNGESRRRRVLEPLQGLTNLVVQGQTALDDLPLERTIAAFIPYARSRSSDAVTLANKSLQLLARGLPLLITGMPHFIERPFIVRADEGAGVVEAAERCQRGFLEWQREIEAFVWGEGPEARLAALEGS